MDINLELYKIFYHVAKTGGFTSAANELNITQPAVSQSIHTLEDAIGTKLFSRVGRGVKLTEAGKTLYQYVEPGIEFIKNGERKVESLKTLDYGELRIGASDMTLQYYLLPYLEEYHTLYPNVKINVTNAPTPLTISHLFSGSIDFGVVSTPLTEDSRMNIKIARPIEDIFIAGEQYEYLKDKVLDYSDLPNFPLICLEPKTSTRKYVDDFLSSNGVTLFPEFELATSNMIVQFVTQNLGIGSVVKDFANRFIAQNRVFELKFKTSIPKREIAVITDNRNELSIAAEKMIELLN